MPDAPDVPAFRELSPTMRVDALLSDWKASLGPELDAEARERGLYEKAWEEYLGGDFGFGLWCWHECDRLTNAFRGSVREVTRVLGAGHYLGFSHRRAIAERVPLDKVYRPRKGDMSTPRTDAIVLPGYQLLCVYLVKAASGDRKAQAQYEIALGELEDRRRADPYHRHFETFKSLWDRQLQRASSEGAGPASAAARPVKSP
ncbi:MAG TPA: hypothetical protein VMH78_08690 [Thermoplasmata archaeon]|nr:hypothetical protein [Thermoplasmata archaeon]